MRLQALLDQEQRELHRQEPNEKRAEQPGPSARRRTRYDPSQHQEREGRHKGTAGQRASRAEDC